MAASDRTVLEVEPREEVGSRASRRLRRDGFVPGVLYGGDDGAQSFKIERKRLRLALATGSNLFDVKLGTSAARPAVVKEQQQDPVRGNLIHLDMMQVRLDEEIQSQVPVELTGTEDAPGVKEGGVLEHVTRELTVEALPTEMPERISLDVSELDVAETLTLESIKATGNFKFIDDPGTLIVTITAATKLEEPEPEIEEETELVGEEAVEAEEEEAAEEAREGEEEGQGGGTTSS